MTTIEENRLQTYNRSNVVDHYANASGLQICEAYHFDKNVKSGDAILDIGVGGGRTTPWWPRLHNASLFRRTLRICKSLYKTPQQCLKRLFSQAFRQGSGCVYAVGDGELRLTFVSTPASHGPAREPAAGRVRFGR